VFHWLIVILSFANCVLIVQLFYCHLIVATAFCQLANKRICYIMLYYVTLLTYLLTKLYVCVCVIQLDGVHLGFILGMVVNVTDSTTLLSQTESLSLALLLPLAILLILLFVAFLLMSFVFLCYAGGRRRHVYKVFFSVFDFIVIIVISARCLGRVCIVITLQCTLARI